MRTFTCVVAYVDWNVSSEYSHTNMQNIKSPFKKKFIKVKEFHIYNYISQYFRSFISLI